MTSKMSDGSKTPLRVKDHARASWRLAAWSEERWRRVPRRGTLPEPASSETIVIPLETRTLNHLAKIWGRFFCFTASRLKQKNRPHPAFSLPRFANRTTKNSITKFLYEARDGSRYDQAASLCEALAWSLT